ncbi:transmembrane protein 217 isoform X2 [Mustela erminea]|uniref:transmembrane protein 217 isoform X2 n=1 Tax=Mustela erminea TaxID=36723 RepID=UPI0013869D7E|nr:transmembrane protein 217 isoform X2 [Mustela erminea]
MKDRTFCLVVGIFSALNSIQFLIFDLNHITTIGFEDKVSIYKETKSDVVSWMLTHKKSISFVLGTLTIAFSLLLIYCTHWNKYLGLLCYTTWIIAYELISFSMVVLIHGVIEEQFKELSYLYWIFQISRMLLHFFCLPFLIRHAYVLYKDPKILSKIARRRHSSVSTMDSWSPVGMGTLYRKLN